MGIVNAFVALLLILTGLRMMLGGSIFRYANVIEVLPGILLALVAANLSLDLTMESVKVNNALGVAVYNQANNLPVTTVQFDGQDIVTKTCNNWYTAGGAAVGAGAGTLIPIPGIGTFIGGVVGGFLGHMIGCDWDPHVTNWNATLQNSSATVPNVGGGLDFLFKSLTNLLAYITSIIALMLLGQVIVRQFLLQFYIILAPLGIGAWALPGKAGQGLTRLWIKGFFSTLFAQFLQVVGLIIIRLLAGFITSNIYAMLHTDAHNDDATLLWLVQIAQFWFIVRIPALLGTSATNMMISIGQTMNQLAQTAVMTTAMEVQFVSSLAFSAAGTAAAVGR